MSKGLGTESKSSDEKNAKGQNYLMQRIINGNDDENEVAPLLARINVNEVDNAGHSALMYAVLNSRVNITKLLLDNGADPNLQSKHSQDTALIMAVAQLSDLVTMSRGAVGSKETISSKVNKYSKIVNLIIESDRIDVNQPNCYCTTPILLATLGNLTQVAESLLNKGANPNIPNNVNQIASYIAEVRGYEKISQAMARGRSQDNSSEAKEETPSKPKSAGQQLQEFFTSLGVVGTAAETSAGIQKTDLERVLKLVSKSNVNSNITSDGWNILHLTARFGHADMVEKLIILQADVNAKTNDRESPLDCAIVAQNRQALKNLLKSRDDEFTAIPFADIKKGVIEAIKSGSKDLVADILTAPKTISDFSAMEKKPLTDLANNWKTLAKTLKNDRKIVAIKGVIKKFEGDVENFSKTKNRLGNSTAIVEKVVDTRASESISEGEEKKESQNNFDDVKDQATESLTKDAIINTSQPKEDYAELLRLMLADQDDKEAAENLAISWSCYESSLMRSLLKDDDVPKIPAPVSQVTSNKVESEFDIFAQVDAVSKLTYNPNKVVVSTKEENPSLAVQGHSAVAVSSSNKKMQNSV